MSLSVRMLRETDMSLKMMFLLFFMATLSTIACANPNVCVGMGPVFNPLKCPSNGLVSCAVDGTQVESHSGISRGQCTAACNKITGCDWFNHFNDSDGGRGLCQLFTEQPPNLAVVSNCMFYKVCC